MSNKKKLIKKLSEREMEHLDENADGPISPGLWKKIQAAKKKGKNGT